MTVMYFDSERGRDDALHSGVQHALLLILVSVNVLLPGMICISAASDVTAFVNGSGGKCPVPLPLGTQLTCNTFP